MTILAAAMLAATGMQGKTIVVYFSATGTTKNAAQVLAKEQNAVLWEIEPAERYTVADLDWRNKQSRSSLEMADPAARPTIKQCTNIPPYDTMSVFLSGGVYARGSSIRGWRITWSNWRARS